MAPRTRGTRGARRARPLPILLAVPLVLALAPWASAQATRTWVSGVGDDTNPCSRTAPCLTWAGAVGNTLAGGEIDALDPGDFGTVTITGSLTLDGGGGQVAGALLAGTNGITVNAGANDVVILRNLRINGGNASSPAGLIGVQFQAGKALHVEHCFIFGFTQAAIDFEPASGGQLFVTDTILSDNQAPGLTIGSGSPSNPSVASLTRVRASNNATGVLAKEGSRVTVTDSEASSNACAGFWLKPVKSAPVEMDIQRSRSTFNTYGVKADDVTALGTAIARISHLTATANGLDGTAATGTGSIASFGNNQIAGNSTGNYQSNIPPSFDPIADQAVAENAPSTNLGVTGVTPTATGPIELGQTVTLTATSAEPGLVPDPTVTGTGTTRTLTFQPTANATGIATITVAADDGQCVNYSFTRQFNIAVGSGGGGSGSSPANVAPGFLVGPNESVPENSGPATFPGWATDILPGPPSESWQTVAFIVTPSNPALFAVAPAIDPTGTLTFTPQAGMVGQTVVSAVAKDDGGTADGGHDTSGPQTFIIAVGQPVEVQVPTLAPLAAVALAAIILVAALVALRRAHQS